jgi:hypothetical protein
MPPIPDAGLCPRTDVKKKGGGRSGITAHQLNFRVVPAAPEPLAVCKYGLTSAWPMRWGREHFKNAAIETSVPVAGTRTRRPRFLYTAFKHVRSPQS